MSFFYFIQSARAQKFPQQFIKPVLLALTILLVNACTVYKPDVAQGNIVNAEQVTLLKVGMSRQQVQQILGSPLLQDVFNSNRWDYVYRYLKNDGKLEQRVFTVFFDASGNLTRWAGDAAPSQNQMALKMEPSAVLASKATNSPSAESLAKVEPQAITPTQAVQTQSQPTTVAVTSLVTAMQLGAPVVTASPTLALVTAPATITPAAVPAAIPASVIAVATQSKLENLKAPLDLQTLIIEKINAWKTAWAAKDLPNYTAHYADDFAGDYPNHAAWLAARQRIISNANIVSISISNIKIIQTSNTEARSAFTQTYQSNKVTESGTKNLYFQRTGDRWLIVAEVFTKNS